MMSMKALVVGAVVAGCLAAATVGGYLAARGGSVESAAAPATAPTTDVTLLPSDIASAVDRPAARTTSHQSTDRQASNSRPVSAARRAPVPAERPTDNPTATTVAESRPSGADRAPEIAAGSPADPEPAPAAAPAVEVHVPAPEPPRARFEELTVATNGVIGIRLETPVSSDTAKVEDRVTAKVVRDVTVDGRVAVPAGSTFEGFVTEVERGGRFRERAKLGIRFTTVVLPDDTRVAVTTDPIYRTGESPTGEATAKIGAATVVGSIVGAAIGGKKGAAIGGATGAAGGTAAVMASGPNFVMLTTGTALTVRLTEPATFQVPIER
jgi:hypothetical protein